MKIIGNYIEGFKSTLKAVKMSFIIYILTLLIVLLIAIPFKNALTNAIGGSMSTYSLLSSFDFSSYKDMLLHNAGIIKYFQTQILWFGLFYLISSIFVTGGILGVLHREKDKFSSETFFSYCAEYFARYLRLAAIVIPLHIFFAVLIYSGMGFIIESQLATVKSEVTIFYIVAAAVILHLIIASLIIIISDYAKIIMVSNDSKKSIRSFIKASVFSLKHLISVYSLYLLLLALPFLAIILYFVFESRFGMVSPEKIIVVFIIQQIFIWLRVFIKVWVLASQYLYFNNYFIPDIEEVEPVLIAEQEEWNLDDLNEPTNA